MSARGFAKLIIVLTTVTAAVMELIDTSIVSVALTDIAVRASAINRAHAVINGSIDKQFYYLSYSDTFRLIAVFFIIVIPLVSLKKKSAQEVAAAMAAAAEAY